LVLLILIVLDPERLEDILEAFLELEITGATVLGARGMGQILAEEVPIFAGLRNLFPGGQNEHSLVLSVTEEGKAAKALSLIPEICGSMDSGGTGIAFTVPVSRAVGLAKEL